MNGNMMETPEELAIALDITSRMAIFAMAKSCTEEEIEVFFDVVIPAIKGCYDDNVIDSMSKQYKQGVLKTKQGLGAN